MNTGVVFYWITVFGFIMLADFRPTPFEWCVLAGFTFLIGKE